MFKNTASQKLRVFAYDSTTNLPKSGDSANITAYVSKDYGAVTVLTDTTATEEDATNAKGFYLFDLTQAETNADVLGFSAKSSTANIVVVAVPAVVYTRPPNFSAMSVDSNGRLDVIKLAGTTQTARDIGASVLLSSGTGAGQVSLSSGAVTVGTNNDKTGYTLSATGIDDIWDESISGHQTLGTTGRSLTLAGTILSETTATGTPTTTTLDLTAGSATNDFYNDLEIIPTSGTLAGQARVITDYAGATKTITVDEPWTSALSAGDTVMIRATHKHSKDQIADAVWDEAQSGHTSAGTFGRYLDAQVANVETDTQDIQTRLPAALVSGRMDSYVGAMGADTITNSAVAASAVTEIQAGLSTLAAADIRTAVGLASANLDTQLSTITGYVDTETSAASVATAVWNAATASYGTAGSYGALLETNIDTTISSRLASASYTAPLDAAGTRSAVGLASANLDTQLTAIDDYLDTEVAAIKAKTDNLPASPAATGDIPSAATIATAVWDSLTSALTTVGSIGKLLVDRIDAAITSRLASASYTAPLDAAGTRSAVGLASANLDTQLDALPTATENADALLKRDMSAVTGEASRSPLNALRALRNKVSTAGAITVYKEDDSTTAWSGTITTDAAADPITVIDPS